MATQRQELMTSTQSYSLAPKSFEEAERLANIIANSGICPDALRGRPRDVLVILQMGHELKLQPMQALRTLGCINGVPFAYGDGFLALIKRHPLFVDIKEWIEGDIGTNNAIAYCTMTRRNQEPQTRSFSIQDAIRAGLWKNPKKSVWMQYPQRMLQHRARTYCGKDVFPDAVFGLMTEDEARNIPTVHEVPKPVNKGLNGLRETLQTKYQDESIIDVEIVESSEEISNEPVSKLDELKNLISQHKIRPSSIKAYLTRCKVENVDELSEEQIDKWSDHLKLKENN